jgi:tetratricopeptide (TPR) repeat protein
MGRTAIAIAAALACLAPAASAPAAPLSVRDTFRIGTSGTIFCSAQNLAKDAALTGMFDLGYAVTCRDAAAPVGKLFKLREAADVEARLSASRNNAVTCTAPASANVADLGRVDVADCKLKSADVGYRVYRYRKGKVVYVAEGLTGYDSALQLGLRSLIADQPVKGEISIATTGAGDPAAFARVQAGTLDPSMALAEAYRRNNAGSYAEAAEFFAAVSNSSDAPLGRAEGLANEALQKSNLGRYAEADALFARAAEQLDNDPSSPAACATIERCICSTKAKRRKRSPSSTSHCPRRQKARRELRLAWQSTRSRPSALTATTASASSSAPNPMNFSQPRSYRFSTRRRSSFAEPHFE